MLLCIHVMTNRNKINDNKLEQRKKVFADKTCSVGEKGFYFNYLFLGLKSQSTIFHSSRDVANASWDQPESKVLERHLVVSLHINSLQYW